MIATIGEALVDMIEQQNGNFKPCLGGSVCNFSLGAARQGVPVTYLNPLSADQFGAQFAARLSASGVQLGAAQRSRLPTSLAIVSVDATGSPSYAFHREAVADRDCSSDSLVASLPAGLAVLHTGGLALMPEDCAKTLAVLAAAAARGALVSVDANLRPLAASDLAAYLGGVRAALRHAHIVKASDEDLAHLGLGGLPLPELAASLFGDSALELLAITRGAHGASLLTRHAQVDLPTAGVRDIVDTVGAGDCFHAGLLGYLHRHGALANLAALRAASPGLLRAALAHAIAAAGINIRRAGCEPASWDETVAASQPR